MVDFNIYQVAQINMLQKLEGARVGQNRMAYICPFCGDKKGRFTISITAGNGNVYKCFHCDEAGGQIALHRKLNGFTSNRDAVKDITKRLEATPNGVVMPNVEAEKKKTISAERKPIEYISKVYVEMLKLLELDEKHANDLKKRGLAEETIRKYWFRSVPKHTLDVAKNLTKQGLDLEGVPGFFINKQGYWDMNAKSGYFCPVWDFERKLILGFQIRLDEPKGSQKYIWFSSVNRKKGCSSHSPATFLKGDSSLVIITEGVLKANVAYALLRGHFSVIGVAGAGSLKGLEPYKKFFADKTVLEAYDMDKFPIKDKEESFKKAKNISKYVEKLRKAMPKSTVFSSLRWDYDGKYWSGNIKGIDDFLVSLNEKERFLYGSLLEKGGTDSERG